MKPSLLVVSWVVAAGLALRFIARVISNVVWHPAFRLRTLGPIGLAMSWFIVIALMLALALVLRAAILILLGRSMTIPTGAWPQLALVAALVAVALAILGMNPTKEADRRVLAAGDLLTRLRDEDLSKLEVRMKTEPRLSDEYAEVAERRPGDAYRAHLDRLAGELSKGHWNAPVYTARKLLAEEQRRVAAKAGPLPNKRMQPTAPSFGDGPGAV